MPEQTISVGRIVHYVLTDQDCLNGLSAGKERPAIATEVYPDGSAQLTVFLAGCSESNANGSGDKTLLTPAVYGSSGPVPGCWHWPERV